MSSPVISSINPTSGTTLGSTSVTIDGTNLSDVTAVTIGTNDATDLNVVSSTQITCTTPAGAAGTENVVAINGNYGTTWTQTGASAKDWYAVAMTDSGKNQTVCVYNGNIYTSTDYGTSWTQATSSTSGEWRSVAMSSDGTYQTACIGGGGGIYTSNNNLGTSWTQATSSSSSDWYSVAMSSDGLYQTAVVNGGGIYTSNNNYGASWTLMTAPSSSKWYSVAMSSDGTYQTAVVYGGGIYTSNNNYGASWTLSSAPSSENWYSVAMSSDGLYQTAVVNSGGIYISSNSGATWTLSSAFTETWKVIAMSSTGKYQTACIADGGIYTSDDYATTWKIATATSANWGLLAMSSDGTYQTATINSNTGSIWTAVPISSTTSIEYTYIKTVISNICFPAGTPVTTDQGNITIDKINPDIHTIHNNPIVAITKTITQDTHLVCFEKHSLGFNKPNKKTITSKNHKVFYNGKMTKAQHFVKQFKNVTEIEYNGEILYNVLMEKHDKLKANNLTFETLDPKNIIAKLYTSNFDEEYKDNIVVMINNSIMQNDHRLYQNIINRVVNDKNLSTCFDEEPEYEYEEPEYEEPVNTTRIDTIRNSAEKTYHAQSVNVKNKISLDNVTLHGKLTKYIKSLQTNEEPEVADFKVKVNLENNTHLQSKLNKYTKMYQNKDNIDEIVKKKEFLNNKKEEKEERERQMRIETKNIMTQPVVEKAKTYKRVNLFKKTGTSKRLF